MTTNYVFTPSERLDIERITAHRIVRGDGGFIAVMHQTHWGELLLPTLECELNLQPSHRMILLYWAGSPVQHQQANHRYRQMRTAAAARELARDKDHRHLAAGYTVVRHDLLRAHFRTSALPVAVYAGYHALDGLWWLDVVSQTKRTTGQYVLRFVDILGPTVVSLSTAAYCTEIKDAISSWCLEARISGTTRRHPA